MNLGQPPFAEPGRQQVPGEAEPIPGQLTLPGMPSAAGAAGAAGAGGGQATLPGLEFPAADAPADGGAVGDGTDGDGAVGDGDLAAVGAELRALDGDGSRMAAAIRGALDMLLDGQHTGRYRWDQLHKTENLVHNREPAGRHGPSGMGHTMARSAHQRRADTLREGADAGWACPAPGSLTALRAAWSRRGEPKPSYNCTLKLPGFSGWPLGDRRPTAC